MLMLCSLHLHASKDNKVNEAAEPDLKPDQVEITQSEFLDMIAPAFAEKATKQDMMAYLKRAHWIVNMNQGIYIRKAGANPHTRIPVVRYPHEKQDFIAESGKAILSAARSGVQAPPPDWLAQRQWCHDLLSLILEKNIVPPRTQSTLVRPLFGGFSSWKEEKPELPRLTANAWNMTWALQAYLQMHQRCRQSFRLFQSRQKASDL